MHKYLTLLAALLLSACAQNIVSLDDKLNHQGLKEGAAVHEIKNLDIRSWQYLDDENIIIHTKNAPYLVRFIIPCPGIATAQTLKYTGSLGRLQRNDRVMVGFGHCRIHEIYELVAPSGDN